MFYCSYCATELTSVSKELRGEIRCLRYCEHLRQHKLLLKIVMSMVNNGHAYAVMGSHEFNALAFHTLHGDEYLRKYTDKYIRNEAIQ